MFAHKPPGAHSVFEGRSSSSRLMHPKLYGLLRSRSAKFGLGDEEEAGVEQQHSASEENGGAAPADAATANNSDSGSSSPSNSSSSKPAIGKSGRRSRSRSSSRSSRSRSSSTGLNGTMEEAHEEAPVGGEGPSSAAAAAEAEVCDRATTTPPPPMPTVVRSPQYQRRTPDAGARQESPAAVPDGGSGSPVLREIKLEPATVDREEEDSPAEEDGHGSSGTGARQRPPSSSGSISSTGIQTPSPTPLPMLRLNVALASDPAANPNAKDLKNIGAPDAAFEEKQSQQHHALNMAIGPPPALLSSRKHQQQQQQVASVGLGKPPAPPPPSLEGPPTLPLAVELPPRLPMYICGPCGIRFSSASTLEAHQTYYCSHRKDADEGGGGAGGSVSSSGTGASAGAGQTHGGKNAHSGGDEAGEPPAKAAKTGKQYACSQCSYSADKKVSLNRHMRMHQTSPAPSPVSAGVQIVNGDDVHHHQHHLQQHQQQQQQQQQLQLIQAQAVAAAAAVLHQQQQQQQQPQHQTQAPQQAQVDRYCSDCDIRFSSTKTYRAHKQHYCSSRHREGHSQSNSSTPKPSAAPKSGSQSPPDVPKTPPVASAASAAAQQPFLALPTNPIIVIPYSLIRSATVIPGLLSSLAPGIANPESACFIFQNGTLQPIAMSLATHVQAVTMAAAPGPTGLEGLVGPVPLQQQQQQSRSSQSTGTSQHQLQQQQQQQSQSRGPTPNMANENSSSHSTNASAGGGGGGGGGGGVGGGGSSTGEVLKAINKRDNTTNKDSTGSTPLDLSVRRLSPGGLGGLSLRERSLSLSSALSLERDRLDFDSLMEGKENLSVSGDSLTPEQIVCAPSLPGSPPLTPSPKRRSNSPRGPHGAAAAAAAVAAAAAAAAASQHALAGGAGGGGSSAAALSLSPLTLQQQLMRPLLPADIALRLSAVGGGVGADPAGVNLNLNILPHSSPHALLTKQSVELALRLSSAAAASGPTGVSSSVDGGGGLAKPQMSPLLSSISPTTAGPGGGAGAGGTTHSALLAGSTPQIFVKQGDSKCKECNIVFCKYENYLAHKKHYCSARNQDDGGSGAGTEHAKISPPISPQAMAGGATGAATSVSVAPGTRGGAGGGAVAYQQLICAACGIKFTSLDNLTAHQMYYCPKRIDATMPVNTIQAPTVAAPAPHKERCSKCKSMHEPGHPCTVAGHGAYKCPICEAISPNSTEARRHMDTHGGVKAFRCTICRYKGNTLRGMRTHIRMHFDKKTSEFNEENYITCILEEDGIEIPPAGAQNAAAMAAAAAALASQKFLPPESSPVAGEMIAAGPPRTSPGNGGAPLVRHHCEFCPYSSSYRINVAKHIKHVHGRERSSAAGGGQSPLIGEGGESLLYNGASVVEASAASGQAMQRPPVSSTPGLGASNSHIKTEPEDELTATGDGAGGVEEDEQDASVDINVDVVMEESPPQLPPVAIKTETIDPHMPSLYSPVRSPTPPPSLAPPPPQQQHHHSPYQQQQLDGRIVPRESAPSPFLNLKSKSHPTASPRSSPLALKTPSPPSAALTEPAGAASPTLPPGPKYCDTCNITFNYTNTYIAHKKFYCKAATAAAAAAVVGSPAGSGGRSASGSPSTGRSATGGSTSPAVTVAVNRATEASV